MKPLQFQTAIQSIEHPFWSLLIPPIDFTYIQYNRNIETEYLLCTGFKNQTQSVIYYPRLFIDQSSVPTREIFQSNNYAYTLHISLHHTNTVSVYQTNTSKTKLEEW